MKKLLLISALLMQPLAQALTADEMLYCESLSNFGVQMMDLRQNGADKDELLSKETGKLWNILVNSAFEEPVSGSEIGKEIAIMKFKRTVYTSCLLTRGE